METMRHRRRRQKDLSFFSAREHDFFLYPFVHVNPCPWCSECRNYTTICSEIRQHSYLTHTRNDERFLVQRRSNLGPKPAEKRLSIDTESMVSIAYQLHCMEPKFGSREFHKHETYGFHMGYLWNLAQNKVRWWQPFFKFLRISRSVTCKIPPSTQKETSGWRGQSKNIFIFSLSKYRIESPQHRRSRYWKVRDIYIYI